MEIGKLTSIAPARLLTWKIFWGLTPFSVLTTVLFVQPKLGSSSDLLAWTAIGLMSHAAMVPFIFYANGKFDRKMHLLLALCMGFVRGITIGLLSPVFRVVDPVSLTLRTINSMISIFYGVFIAAILIAVWTGFSRDLREILADAINNETFKDKKSDIHFKGENLKNYQEVQALILNLNNFFETILKSGDKTFSLEKQAKVIDDLIKKHIRPHSKKRWDESEHIWPRAKFRNVAYQALTRTPLPLISVVLATLPLSLFGSFVRYGLIRGGVSSLSSLLMILVVNQVAIYFSHFFDQQLKVRNIFFCCALPLFSLPIDLVQALIFDSDYKGSTVATLQPQLLATITFIFLACSASIILNVKNERISVLNFLRSSLSQPALQTMVEKGIAASTDSDFAQYLHAEVQSELLACKLLLLKAAGSNFEGFSPEVTQKVLERLKTLNAPYEKSPARIPSVRLGQMCKTWHGLAEITLDLGPELFQVSQNGEVVSQLIEESLVNAIRHGKAKTIIVKARVEGSTCFISVQDDGLLKSSKHSGLGSTLFAVFAPDWRLATNAQGTLATLSTKF